MATRKVTYQCAGCGTTKQVEAQADKPSKPLICCGQPMKEVAKR